MSDELAAALTERNRILTDLDVEAAKEFIVRHGGRLPNPSLDWLRVLHLARFDVRSTVENLRLESQVYLAFTGAQSLATLPSSSPYMVAAMDLVFPRDLFMAAIDEGATWV